MIGAYERRITIEPLATTTSSMTLDPIVVDGKAPPATKIPWLAIMLVAGVVGVGLWHMGKREGRRPLGA